MPEQTFIVHTTSAKILLALSLQMQFFAVYAINTILNLGYTIAASKLCQNQDQNDEVGATQDERTFLTSSCIYHGLTTI
jgi:hypothetical protein